MIPSNRVLTTLMFCAAGSCLLGQTTFEVASIKPSPRGFSTSTGEDGGFRATGITLSNLVALAYGVPEYRVEGGPNWASSDLWAVDARTGVPGRLTGAKYESALRQLLEQRFNLRATVETKEGNVFYLDLAKSGAKMKVTSDGSGVPKISFGNGMISSYNLTTDRLANVFTRLLGRPVLDRTGLTGAYEVFMSWTPEAGEGDPSIGPPPPELNVEKRSVFAAVEEDLGLKLTSGRQPLPLITIQSAARPDAN